MTPKHSLYNAEGVLSKKDMTPYFCWGDYVSLDKKPNIIIIKGRWSFLSQQFELPNPDNLTACFPKVTSEKSWIGMNPKLSFLLAKNLNKERLILGQHLNPEIQLLMIQNKNDLCDCRNFYVL